MFCMKLYIEFTPLPLFLEGRYRIQKIPRLQAPL